MSFGFGFALPAYPLRGGTGNNPFNQLGPTLDLSFTGVVTDLTDPNGYTLNTDFIIPQYQIAAQYVVWETGVGLVDKTFSQIITFTRASTATYFDSAGVLQTAAINAPRFDYNPSTFAAQGFLIEESRTNSIRNNTMVGAAAGTPGTLPTNWTTFTTLTGLTREIVGTGTESGITYIDIRLSGTPSAAGAYFINYETTTQVVASSGQAWTSSAYYKLQAGSLTGVTAVINAVSARNAVGGDLSSTTTTFVPTSAALNTQRVSSTIASNPALTAFETQFLRLDLSGATIDITLRIGLPQLEQGAFATSVIPTTTTALTRSADVASVNTLSPWYNATEGTMYAQASLISSSYLGGVLVDVGTGGAFGTTEYIVWTGAAWSLSPNIAPINVTSSVTTSSTAKVAAGLKVNDSVIAGNGLIGTTDTSCSIASAPTTLSIGKAGWTAGNYLNGWIQRITYYPRRLTNLELQTITLPAGATITTQEYSLDTNFIGNTVAIGS